MAPQVSSREARLLARNAASAARAILSNVESAGSMSTSSATASLSRIQESPTNTITPHTIPDTANQPTTSPITFFPQIKRFSNEILELIFIFSVARTHDGECPNLLAALGVPRLENELGNESRATKYVEKPQTEMYLVTKRLYEKHNYVINTEELMLALPKITMAHLLSIRHLTITARTTFPTNKISLINNLITITIVNPKECQRDGRGGSTAMFLLMQLVPASQCLETVIVTLEQSIAAKELGEPSDRRFGVKMNSVPATEHLSDGSVLVRWTSNGRTALRLCPNGR